MRLWDALKEDQSAEWSRHNSRAPAYRSVLAADMSIGHACIPEPEYLLRPISQFRKSIARVHDDYYMRQPYAGGRVSYTNQLGQSIARHNCLARDATSASTTDAKTGGLSLQLQATWRQGPPPPPRLSQGVAGGHAAWSRCLSAEVALLPGPARPHPAHGPIDRQRQCCIAPCHAC